GDSPGDRGLPAGEDGTLGMRARDDDREASNRENPTSRRSVLGSMRAAVLSEPGPVANLRMVDLPIPEPASGWVRIKVKAFGLNRSELHTRLGLAEGVTLPRVLGIEAVGVVDSDCDLPRGRQVAAMMGGMGRTFDGGYAEYTAVPRSQLIPFRS